MQYNKIKNTRPAESISKSYSLPSDPIRYALFDITFIILNVENRSRPACHNPSFSEKKKQNNL